MSAWFLRFVPSLRAQSGQGEEYTFSTLAGLAGAYGSVDGTGSQARFYLPEGVAVDSEGNGYVPDSGNHIIRFGTPACPDRPTVDIPVAPAGLTRQLDTSP